MQGIRSRLTVTLLALVVLTVTGIGIGTYAFVDARLRETLLQETSRQAQFDLSVLLPGRLADDADRAAFEASGLPAAFRLRGDADLIADFGDGDPYLSRATLLGTFQSLPASLKQTVDAGRIGYAWLPTGQGDLLVVGGRGSSGPAVYLVVDAGPVEATLAQLRIGLAAGALTAIALAIGASRFLSRRILRPVASGTAAAARIAGGDLGARVPVEGNDEFGAWAVEFNRMAASLQATVHSLEAAQAQNRRFVADVSHELRTPIAALVTEASIIETSLPSLPAEARRATELLIEDVRRLRVLTEDLMELSRFDADAEAVALETVDLGAVVRTIVAARFPEARLAVPSPPLLIESDVRRLDRIVGNLLDNARIHAPGSPVEVMVSATPTGGAAIEVSDRGPGVAAAVLPHLFERFYKADPSRGAAPAASSGLGLAIAAEHAALLGGSLEASGRRGGGLTFVVTLPVAGPLPGGGGAETSVVDGEVMSEPTSRIEP